MSIDIKSELEDISNKIRVLQDYIYKNEQSFLTKFSHDGDILYGVSFSSDSVHFKYMTYEGQHFSNYVDIESFLEWYKE